MLEKKNSWKWEYRFLNRGDMAWLFGQEPEKEGTEWLETRVSGPEACG